nr:MAG TPA: hypothetical protein [Caudoviricetes sp.]
MNIETSILGKKCCLQHIDLYKKIKCYPLIRTASINGINVSSKN